MDNKRSYLDTLNDGRQRRAQTSLDELSRTLESLESRFDQAQRAARERAQPARDSLPGYRDRLAASTPRPSGPAGTGEPLERARLPLAARDGDVTNLAEELRSLRTEMRHQMSTGIKHEFDTLRQEMARPSPGPDLSRELVRLTLAVDSLAHGRDDGAVAGLRAEIEEMKVALGELAREDSLRSSDRRWDDFDRRWTAFEERVVGGAPLGGNVEALVDRLEHISGAVERLPEAASIKALDDKVRQLASAMERFSAGKSSETTAVLSALDDRLDEISRAIAAASTRATPAIDPLPFERIEARLALLTRNFEDLAMSRESSDVSDRLTMLVDRVDDLAARTDTPDETLESLTRQMADIAAKLDRPQTPLDTTGVMNGIDERLSLFSDTLVQRLDETEKTGKLQNARMQEALEARIAALTLRMETSQADMIAPEVIKEIGGRLDDIASRIEETGQETRDSGSASIRGLEAQIAGLAARLASASDAVPASADRYAPRLDEIERAILDNRDAVLEAARLAAESAVMSFSGSRDDKEAVSALASDLKSLESLARRSDDRNARTFEAIHDTLLKIVDRLGSLDAAPSQPRVDLRDAP